MFTELSIRTARKRSLRLVIALAVAGSAIAFGSGPVSAASGTQIVTGATQGGVLSITAPGTLILPTLVAGTSTAATNRLIVAPQ